VKRYPKWWISTLAACYLLGVATAQGSHPIELAQDSQQGETASQPLEFVPKRVIVKFRPELAPVAVQMITDALLTEVEGSIPELGVLFLKVPDDADEKDYEALFQSLPAVEYAELDYIVPPATSYSRTVIPNDPWFNPNHESYQHGWHLTRIGAPAAWYYQRGNPRIIIALIDTGVNVVSDLMGALVPGWNFYDNNTDTRDVAGHGTSVAGVLAARTNNGIGVAGVTWNCRIMPLRISAPNGNGSYGVAAQAIVWAANNGARVANLSWAMGQSELVRDAARYFMQTARGVVVIPAGNDGLPASGNPPDNPYILRVSAIDRPNVRASFSGYGTDIDLCAPGDYIATTTRINDTYTLAGGTSYSAPIVAGVAALALSANPYLSGEQLQNILKETAVDIGPPGWDWEYGWGCVNAYRVVMRARGLVPETTPPTIRFTTHRNGDVVSGAFWVGFEADDMSGLSHVELWVDRTYTSEVPVKIGYKINYPYRFWWDSRTVPPGVRTLTAVVYDGAGNRGVHPIQVYVNNPEDRQPPTVVITFINGQPPVDGMVLEGDGLVVEVDARDDVGVVRAELYVNGTRRYTTTVPPFTFRGSTRTWTSGEHTLEVRVYDGVGRIGVSPTVRVIKP